MEKIAWLKIELTIDVLYGSDNRLQVDPQIYLQGKKKLPGKRITGFQVAISYPLLFPES